MVQPLPQPSEIDLEGAVRYRLWDGPGDTTFVLVHGLGGSSLSWIDVAPDLSGLGRVLAIDLLGFGETPRAGRDTGLMAQRRMISRFLGELTTGRVVLCGNSMGGLVSVLQGAVEPSSVAGIVLTCSVYPPVPRALPHPIVMGAFSAYATPRVGEWFSGVRYRGLDVDRLVRIGFGIVAADRSSVSEELILATVELEKRRRSDPEAAAAFLEAARSMLRFGRRPITARRALDGVRSPVLVLHGRRDRLVPIEWAAAELDRHPSWRYRFFPDLGHVPQIEAPGRWLAAVADWFALAIGKQSAPSRRKAITATSRQERRHLLDE